MAKKQPGKQRASLSPGKKVLILALCAAVLVLAAVGMWSLSSASDPFPRLEVAGFRISQEEYLRAMYQARNDVLSDHATAGISLKDWSGETALGDPKRLTMERAIGILTEYYAVGTLAVERGYLADASYGAMKRDMEEINKLRQETLNTGGVVTGISQFSLEDYLSYRASGIRLQFCSDPANPENQVTQEEILQRYEADRDALYRQPDSLELEFLVISDTEAIPSAELMQLRSLALEKGSLAAALEEMPLLGEFYQEISVTPENYSIYARSHGDILAYSQGLDTGELSEIIALEGWQCLIRCRQRTVHQYVPLEDVQSVVIQSIRESRYDALVAQRMENTRVRGDLEELYRFTAEQLR